MSEPAETPAPDTAPGSPSAGTAEPVIAEPAVMAEPAAPARPSGGRAQGSPGRGATGRGALGRGVTGRGVVVLIFVLSAVVGLLEVLIGGHRGAPFAITFILTSAVSALVVRRRDIATAMIAPPLIYCVLIVLLSVVDTKGLAGGLATREAFYIANGFVTGAPTMWTGTIVAVLIGWYRLRTAPARPRGRQLPA